jgi:hypothetical protein
MFLGDLHLHSTFSDGQLTIPELVDLFGSRGFGAIAITDHICEGDSVIGRAAHILRKTLTPATFPLYAEIIRSEAERAWHQYRMIVLPGFELTNNSLRNSRSAHILGIGVTHFLGVEGDVTAQARAIRAQGALAIAAHPVSTRKFEKQTLHMWGRREELAPEFDAWEVASGPYLFSDVLHSGLPMVANSDLHALKQLSSWKTVFQCERHLQAILDAIRTQQVSFQFYQDVTSHDYVRNSLHSALGLRSGIRTAGHLLGAQAF